MDLSDEFDQKFEAIKMELPLRSHHPEIAFTDKVMLKAKLDLIALECLPHEMTVDEMMHVSRAAYAVVVEKWAEWIEKGSDR